ncbi:MAG: Na/Pi cotransporter family protein [Deltaproteobacteria bacterium]|nr:Na/Pi cotransporter family protein [Deltaproteobacteria bacterium]
MIFTLIAWLLGGLGIFLLGMDFSSKGLRHLAGHKMKSILTALTSNRLMALIFGIIATAVLQSSSASTVMLVGFVEATAMTLTQAIGVTLGAKIGTTLTVQIISFNLSEYALILVALGYILKIWEKNPAFHSSGNIILGFGLIFFGMGMMSQAMTPLRNIEWVKDILINLGHNPIAAIIIATLFTGVIQSSAATIGLAIALCSNNLITIEAALPLAWGAHIGTSATALLASIGTGRGGKQVALSHLIVSVTGVLLALPFLGFFIDAAKWLTSMQGGTSTARELANGHMIFTIATSLTLLWFVKPVEWLTKKILPISELVKKFAPKYLNSASLSIPDLAIDLAAREITRLFDIVNSMFTVSISMLEAPEYSSMSLMDEEDDKVDILEKSIRPYLASIPYDNLTPQLNALVHAYIYIVQDLENIGDIITKEIAHASKKLDKRDLEFSKQGLDEIREYHLKLVEKFQAVKDAVKNLDVNGAIKIIEDTEADRLFERTLRWNHIERLHNGLKASVETSAWHLSVLGNLRSISEKLDDISMIIVDEVKS